MSVLKHALYNIVLVLTCFCFGNDVIETCCVPTSTPVYVRTALLVAIICTHTSMYVHVDMAHLIYVVTPYIVSFLFTLQLTLKESLSEKVYLRLLSFTMFRVVFLLV